MSGAMSMKKTMTEAMSREKIISLSIKGVYGDQKTKTKRK
jgi:hypothetical protein